MVNRDTISMIVRKNPGLLAGKTSSDGQPEIAPADVTPLQNGYGRVRGEIEDLLMGLHGEGKKLAIWGASHQGFTLAATLGLAGRVEYIIDSAPFKQGRFAPASHLPIVPPEYYFKAPVDAVLIVAPGYTDEIAGIIRKRFGAEVRIMTLRTDHIEELR